MPTAEDPIRALLTALQQEERLAQFVTHIEQIPPRAPVFGAPTRPLPRPLANHLTAQGLTLYAHQAEVINHLRQGDHVLLTTPTASGKTLAFNLPILERLLADPDATALYVYPTKALCQDQWNSFQTLADAIGVRVDAAVYDGDTPPGRKGRIRADSRAVFTNFYEWHHVMAWHYQWERFWRRLAFVVVDEAHTYRGIFGSHVSLVLRRLRRLAAAYGAAPQFVLASATLANAAQFGESLVGEPLTVVDRDASGHGPETVVFYNTEVLGPRAASPHQESAFLVARSIAEGVQTLCFVVSRHMAEVLTQWVRDNLRNHAPGLEDRVMSYRAGYLPNERRALERALKDGTMRGLITTNALEVGIDIGQLDVVVLSGYPGTMISTRQQMGRAGRAGQPSLVVWVPFPDPLEQYLARHPAHFFQRPHEHALLDGQNPFILAGHLLCAAAERPLRAAELTQFFGPRAPEAAAELAAAGLLADTPRGYIFQSHPAPTQTVQLDAVGGRPTVRVLVDGHTLLETMDWSRALYEAHRGAVLLHQGATYVVQDLDLDRRVATVVKQSVDYWTDPVDVTDIRVVRTIRSAPQGMGRVHWGDVEVTTEVTGFRTRQFDQTIGFEPLDLPKLTYTAPAVWFTLPASWADSVRFRRSGVMGGLHAAEHAMAALMPLTMLCDRGDLGALSIPLHPDTGEATIFVHEHAPGGIGLTAHAFREAASVVHLTRRAVRDCPCEEGCPACILSPTCSSDNVPISKSTALLVLDALDGDGP